MFETITQTIKIIILQNNSQKNPFNNPFAVSVSIPNEAKALGFCCNENNAANNHANNRTITIPHQIAKFLNDRLIFAHFFTSVGFFT